MDIPSQQSLEHRPTRPIPTRRQPGSQSTTKAAEHEQHNVRRLETSLSDLQLDRSSALSKHHQEDPEVCLLPLDKWFINTTHTICRRADPQREQDLNSTFLLLRLYRLLSNPKELLTITV
jgi:hypothetical protein